MKRIVFSLILLVSLSSAIQAKWGTLPLDEAIQASDLIVIGTLHDVKEYSRDEVDYGQGSITVEEVIWGNATAGAELTLTWQNRSFIACPRVEHKYNENRKAIWLLNFVRDGEVVANHPQRVVSLSERENVEKYILTKKVCLRIYKYKNENDWQTKITIIYRNPTDADIEFPGIEARGGYIYVSPDVNINLGAFPDGDNVATPLWSDKVIVSDGIMPVVVESKKEYTITFDIEEFLKIRKNQIYDLRLYVKGHGSSNRSYDSIPDEAPLQKMGISSPEVKTENKSSGQMQSTVLLLIIGMAACRAVFNHRRRKPDAL